MRTSAPIAGDPRNETPREGPHTSPKVGAEVFVVGTLFIGLKEGVGEIHDLFGQAEKSRRGSGVSITPIRECIPPLSGEQVTEALPCLPQQCLRSWRRRLRHFQHAGNNPIA